MKNLLSSQWTKLAYANYIVPAEVVEKYLPPHTKIDYYNGNCLVSLVGFNFSHIKFQDIKIPTLADFEQVDLRVYVKRFDGTNWRHGYVVISRILDNVALNILAKLFLKGNSRSSQTSKEIIETENSLEVKYSWQFRESEHFLELKSENLPSPYTPDSETEFILDRKFQYSRLSDSKTTEVEFSHPAWHTYRVNEYAIKVDFALEFGAEFSMLSTAMPHSVVLAEGSTVEIKEGQVVNS